MARADLSTFSYRQLERPIEINPRVLSCPRIAVDLAHRLDRSVSDDGLSVDGRHVRISCQAAWTEGSPARVNAISTTSSGFTYTVRRRERSRSPQLLPSATLELVFSP